MSTSLWAHTLPADEVVRTAPLERDVHADVTIVGAGYTGLWTAYYLTAADPSLHIRVVDAHEVGHGASGRNGGWCSAELPMPAGSIVERHGRHAALAMHRAMHRTVAEVARVLTAEGIDAGVAHGGSVTLARNAHQRRRLIEELAEARRLGVEEQDRRWLSEPEARQLCAATDVAGGVFTPHCLALHPRRLVHGLARAVQRRGVVIHESTPAVEIEPELVETPGGAITSEVVVLATEAFRATLPGRRRELLPIYSLMVATEPLPDAVWATIGLADRPTFQDARHVVIYGQRTADGRLAFGGRGAPYHFRSRLAPEFDTDERVRDRLVATARTMFPALGDVEFPYHWGGPLAVARDWHPHVMFDPRSRMGSAGGYAGDGVATSNLAGRTLAELITGQRTSLAHLPWVGHLSPAWELEPWRWLGVNAARLAAERADRAEATPGRRAERRATRWRGVLTRLQGR